MSYCSISDVEVLMPQAITFGSTTRPTKAQVQQKIDIIAAEIDARLQGMYNVPITGANSLKILSYVNALGVIAIFDIPVLTSTGELDHEIMDRSRERYKEQLNAILAGEISLSDAVQNTTSPAKSVHAYDEIAFTKKSLDDFIKGSKID